MNRYSIRLVAFGLLTSCVTVPPLPLTADHPASPSAPQPAVHPLRNALAADDLTKKTREILAQAGEQQPAPTPLPEQHQMDQMPGMNALAGVTTTNKLRTTNNMTVNRFFAFSSIFALASAAGIAREKEEAFESVQQSVQQRTGKAVRWEEDQKAREQALQDVRQVLRKPLTVDAAVQIALLNNRSLQATFEEIGLSAADVLEAATIPNPRFDLAVRFPDKPPSGTYVDYSAAIDFLSIIMIPLKKRVAKDQLESAALRVADETLELISLVKSAFYSLQASQQLLQRFKLIVDTNAAALDLAQRQYEAGNISDLALARQQATYSRSRLDVATTETEIRRNREKLKGRLGRSLWYLPRSRSPVSRHLSVQPRPRSR